MRNRRILALLLAGAAAVTITGCGADGGKDVNTTNAYQQVEETVDAGIAGDSYWISEQVMSGEDFHRYNGEIFGLTFPLTIDSMTEMKHDLHAEIAEMLDSNELLDTRDSLFGAEAYAFFDIPGSKHYATVMVNNYSDSESITVKECINKGWWHIKANDYESNRAYECLFDIDEHLFYLDYDDLDRITDKFGTPNYIGFAVDVSEHHAETNEYNDFSKFLDYYLVWDNGDYVISIQIAENLSEEFKHGGTYQRFVSDVSIYTKESFQMFKEDELFTYASIDDKDALIADYFENNCGWVQ